MSWKECRPSAMKNGTTTTLFVSAILSQSAMKGASSM